MNKNTHTQVFTELAYGPAQRSFLSTHINTGKDAKMGDRLSQPDGSSYALVADHCVKGSEGAGFLPGLDKNADDHTVLVGTDVPAFSAFRDLQPAVRGVVMTNLNMHLRSNNITDVYVVGFGLEEMVICPSVVPT